MALHYKDRLRQHSSQEIMSDIQQHLSLLHQGVVVTPNVQVLNPASRHQGTQQESVLYIDALQQGV